MVSSAYLFERFAMITYGAGVFYTAMTNPTYFGHLTYWTLGLHVLYFTVDKSSPSATTAIYLLHIMSFTGAMAVFIGYFFIAVAGTFLRFGSYLEWENAIGAHAGTVAPGRTLQTLVIQKTLEHVWPVLCAIIDCHLSKDTLKQVYAGAKPLRTGIFGIALFLGYASVWEAFQKAAGGQGNPLVIYQQPDIFETYKILGALGLDQEKLASMGVTNELPDDLIFTTSQKIMLVLFSLYMFTKFVKPLIGVAAKGGATTRGKSKAL